MIISRTPFRVSLFGGGTDYPVWYRENGGTVLAATIDKYCYITCRYLPPFFNYKTRVLYSKVESVASNDLIEHPAVREALKYLNITEGMEIHHDGDLPARTGLGSSSSFTVGLLHALYALKQSMPSKLQLAKEAIHLEQSVLKESVGCQDQILAAHGGLNRIEFLAGAPEGSDFRISPIIIPSSRMRELQDHCMLFFTGFQRTASEIAEEQIRRTGERTKELSRMQAMAQEAIAILAGEGTWSDFGTLLDESWQIKRSLTSKISTPEIDSMYETAKSAGAWGGKLLGAGGGGFLLLFAAPENQPEIRARLSRLLHVPFRFESEGSRIVFYQQDAVSAPIPRLAVAGVNS